MGRRGRKNTGSLGSSPGNGSSAGKRMIESRRVGSHRLGSHVLTVGERLGRHLRSHGDLVHLGSRRMSVGQSWAAAGLVWRVRERRERTSLVGVELRTHVGSGARLVGRAEVGAWRVGHLALITRLRVSAAAATLVMIATTTRTGRGAHIAMGGLGRFATEVGGLRTGAKGGLLAHLFKRKAC